MTNKTKTKNKTFTVDLDRLVVHTAVIQVKAKDKVEAKQKAQEEIEDMNVEWFYDREEFKIKVK
jgi:hypothetical protein